MTTPNPATSAPREDLFIVTLCDEGDGPALEDLSFTTSVRAKDREEACRKALLVLRQRHPGQLQRVWSWSTWPRYYTEA